VIYCITVISHLLTDKYGLPCKLVLVFNTEQHLSTAQSLRGVSAHLLLGTQLRFHCAVYLQRNMGKRTTFGYCHGVMSKGSPLIAQFLAMIQMVSHDQDLVPGDQFCKSLLQAIKNFSTIQLNTSLLV